jgi:alkylated DNA repair dioxygenase AlkB
MSAQLSFLPVDDPEPQGLRYWPDFISPDEERDLITRLAALPLQPFQFGQYEGKRRVASFGWRYDFTHHKLESAEDLPDWIAPFAARVEQFADLPNGVIQHALCTEYDIGAGIGWHRDRPQFGEVFGVSLGSACKFRFRRKAGAKWERFTLDAQPRSLYGMSGEARSIWEHSIPEVEALRYSITFRTMAEDYRVSR